MGAVSTMGPWKLLFTPSTGGAVVCFAAVKPLRCMMSSCPAKCWERFHFSFVSKSKAKEVFKYLQEIHLVYAIYFTH